MKKKGPSLLPSGIVKQLPKAAALKGRKATVQQNLVLNREEIQAFFLSTRLSLMLKFRE